MRLRRNNKLDRGLVISVAIIFFVAMFWETFS